MSQGKWGHLVTLLKGTGVASPGTGWTGCPEPWESEEEEGEEEAWPADSADSEMLGAHWQMRTWKAPWQSCKQ